MSVDSIGSWIRVVLGFPARIQPYIRSKHMDRDDSDINIALRTRKKTGLDSIILRKE